LWIRHEKLGDVLLGGDGIDDEDDRGWDQQVDDAAASCKLDRVDRIRRDRAGLGRRLPKSKRIGRGAPRTQRSSLGST
jgi:hypothetical protein